VCLSVRVCSWALCIVTVCDLFLSLQDASKSHNYCGDVAYLAALLRGLGFSATQKITMTNKIKSVELVWTLGTYI